MNAVLIILLSCLSFALSLDFVRLTDDCLRGRSLQGNENLRCVTPKGLIIQHMIEDSQTFYCLKYEKKSGNKNEFDVLSFDLHEDYDLKFIGANVLSSGVTAPQFKLYDTRSRPTYKGRFAITSENSAFEINSISISDEDQVCRKNGNQVWPAIGTAIAGETYTTTTYRPPTWSMQTTTPWKMSPITDESCGIVKATLNVDNFFSLPTRPGQFPWTVAIYRYLHDEQESIYKCGGTIIDKFTILTSVNCLLEDGLMLKHSDLQVYVSPYSLSARQKDLNIYNIAELNAHELYNYHLDNNIAALKLAREIEFSDYVQPICLPDANLVVNRKIGKLAGFGKSSSRLPPKSDILTEAEYYITTNYGATFNAENTSGNNRFSDLGSGLYINETNHWTLVGIMSMKVPSTSEDSANNVFTFTSVPNYVDWLRTFNKQE